MRFYFEDFTEFNYKKLIELAKQKYNFITYQDIKASRDNVIIWRHDVDYSMHRALKLAEIEADLGIVSTYFLNFHSNTYNLLENEVFEIGKNIIKLGHKVGLHFDATFYNLNIDEVERFYECLGKERRMLEDLYETNVSVFSFHNPDVGGWLAFEEYSACGMINTYSLFLKNNFTYCSDSNGYWRFKRLEDVLNSGEKKLHILTHPVWWVPNEMSPRERINRCIDGRKDKCNLIYDNLLDELGRLNVR